MYSSMQFLQSSAETDTYSYREVGDGRSNRSSIRWTGYGIAHVSDSFQRRTMRTISRCGSQSGQGLTASRGSGSVLFHVFG